MLRLFTLAYALFRKIYEVEADFLLIEFRDVDRDVINFQNFEFRVLNICNSSVGLPF